MNKQITNVVISLLEQYHDTKRKIAVLRYELEHPATVSPDEMIRAMSFAHGDGEGHAAGHISNKTLYIAMNYQTEAARLSGENMDEIMRQLIPLEREVHRLEHHLSLLPSRAQTVLRMYYMEKMPWEAIAEALSSTPRTAQKLRVAAVAQLAELYSCVKPAD